MKDPAGALDQLLIEYRLAPPVLFMARGDLSTAAHRVSWMRQVTTSPDVPMAPNDTPSMVRTTAPALPARTMMLPVAFNETTFGGFTTRPETLD